MSIQENYLDAYLLLSRALLALDEKKDVFSIRKDALLNTAPGSLIKVSFDTRRINQETEFNPRRNLQSYHRSEDFINEGQASDVKQLFRIRAAIEVIKERFIGTPEWLDSYARILSDSLDRSLRVKQADMDFFQRDIDYLRELLQARYRLHLSDLDKKSDKEIENLILAKDEPLRHKEIYSKYTPDKELVKTTELDTDLIKTLFAGVKADRNNREVERTVTITIKDKVID